MNKITLKISALILTLMITLPAFSQVTLKYNLKKGEVFKQNIVTNMDLTQKIMQQEMKVSATVDMKTTFEVKDVKDANYVLEMKFKEMKMNTAMPGMSNLVFDSNTPEDIATLQDLGPMLKAIIDIPMEMVLTKTGKLESVKGADKLVEAMLNSLDTNIPDATKQQLISQFGAQFSDEYFKSLFAQNEGYFSDKPVKTGDSWEHKLSAVPTANFTMNINLKMTVKNIDNNTVTFDTEGTVSTPEGYETEINGMKAKISMTGVQKGWVKIDKNTGWTVSSEINQDAKGEIEAMGMKIPVSIKSTVSSSDN
jgi:hypothetical protein